MIKKGSKVALVCCSNGQVFSNKGKLKKLHDTLVELGLKPVWSDYIYAKEGVFSGTAKERAEALMTFYRDEEIRAIFDISGGDIANEILPYLDFEVIAKAKKLFWGYSDLTTILNAVYTMTGQTGVLYQVRNLIYDHEKQQIQHFSEIVAEDGIKESGKNTLFSLSCRFVQKEQMKGIVVGGNIRCLLKLAGTPYFPDMSGKILLLEAYGGEMPQMVTYLNQLKLMGVFDKVSGILLGTFTKLEEAEGSQLAMAELVKRYAGLEIPIAVTREIGHGTDSKAVIIGQEMCLKNKVQYEP